MYKNIIFSKQTYVHWTLGGFPKIMSHFVPIRPPWPCPAPTHPTKYRSPPTRLPIYDFLCPASKCTNMHQSFIKERSYWAWVYTSRNLQKLSSMTHIRQPDWSMWMMIVVMAVMVSTANDSSERLTTITRVWTVLPSQYLSRIWDELVCLQGLICSTALIPLAATTKQYIGGKSNQATYWSGSREEMVECQQYAVL